MAEANLKINVDDTALREALEGAGRLADKVAEVKILNLGPDDVPVLRLSREMTLEEMDMIQQAALAVWPNHRPIVLGPGVDIEVTRDRRPVHRARGIRGISVACPQCKVEAGTPCQFERPA